MCLKGLLSLNLSGLMLEYLQQQINLAILSQETTQVTNKQKKQYQETNPSMTASLTSINSYSNNTAARNQTSIMETLVTCWSLIKLICFYLLATKKI